MSRAFLEALHADPWAPDFHDLAALNAHASQAVEGAIEHVRRSARAEPRALRSTSTVILGAPGAGKTHLFSRLRRKLGPRAVFALVRPLMNAEMSPRFVLGEIVRQLAFAAPRGLSQAATLVGSLLGRLDGTGPLYPSTVLSEYSALSPEQREARLETALEGMLALYPELDEVYLTRLLSVPFADGATSRALLAWLSGQDCDEAQLRRIQATSSLGDTRALLGLRTLAAAAGLGAPLVLVFDQLENLMDAAGGGSRLRAYANLAAEFVDVLRGVVLVHLALDSEWERGIDASFNLAQRSRIVMRREALALPAASEREALLELFYRRVLTPKAPFPWPLGSRRVEQLAAEPGLTPRRLLGEFKAALELGGVEEAAGEAEATRVEARPGAEVETEPASSSAPESAPRSAPARRDIASEWLGRLRGARESVRAASTDRVPLHSARLADGVIALGQFVPGLRFESRAHTPALLVLHSGHGAERVAILQESNQRSAAAVLARLTRVTEHARVLVLREEAHALPASWVEPSRRRELLLQTGRARWISVAAEDCARVLALAALLQAARSGDVTDSRGQPVSEPEVREWVEATLEVGSWTLALALCGREPRQEAHEPERAAPESYIQELGGGRAREPVAGRHSSALPTLQRLRVASFERLVREVLRVDPAATRASVLAELDSAGDSVRWLGRSIVFLREQE